jgi:predicted HTH transcriptional regulator
VDLVTLLSRPEGKTLEFKRDLSSPEGVLKTIVAFANTSGGVIVLGVEDGTKKVMGVRDVLAEEEFLPFHCGILVVEYNGRRNTGYHMRAARRGKSPA